MRPCVRATRGSARDGYRGPTRAEKKMYAGGGATRADKKAGKNLFRRERRRGREKKIIWAGAKKILAPTRTQPTKKELRTVETCSYFTYSSQAYQLEGAATIRLFLKVNPKEKKYFLKVNAKKQKLHDD